LERVILNRILILVSITILYEKSNAFSFTVYLL